MPKYPIPIPYTVLPELQKKVNAWAKALPAVNDTLELRAKIDKWGYSWFRSGVLVRGLGDKILMVHEGRVQVKKIKDPELKAKLIQKILQDNPECENPESEWVDGDGGWNFPAGRLGIGESFEWAAEREVMEESNCVVGRLHYLAYRQSDKPTNLYLMPIYETVCLWAPESFSSREILEIGWFTSREIHVLAEQQKLRSPEFVLDALKRYED